MSTDHVPLVSPCLLCGALDPGHVEVRNHLGRRVGRVCSAHTLAQIFQDPTDRLFVHVELQQPDDSLVPLALAIRLYGCEAWRWTWRWSQERWEDRDSGHSFSTAELLPPLADAIGLAIREAGPPR